MAKADKHSETLIFYYGVECSKRSEVYVSKLEAMIGKELEVRFPEGVTSQPSLQGCVFERGGKYTPDFLLNDYNLYIEVKGWMSLYAVNMLLYCHRMLNGPLWYYVFQGTEEGWMNPFDEMNCTNPTQLCEQNIQKQFQELEGLKTGKVTAQELSLLSRKRLENYIWHRNGDLSRWQEMYRQRYGKDL